MKSKIICLAATTFILMAFSLGLAAQDKLTGSGRVKAAAISPDGKYVAYARYSDAEGSGVWVKQVAGGDVQVIAPSGAYYKWLTFSSRKPIVPESGNRTSQVLERIGAMVFGGCATR